MEKTYLHFLGTCDAEWEQHGDFCYHRFDNQFTWQQASDDCEAQGGTLADVPNQETNNFLHGMADDQ